MKNIIPAQQPPDRNKVTIKHLGPGKLLEKEKTISLYKEAFPEDCDEYVRYYYDWKGSENEILILKQDLAPVNPAICAMLHLNPYQMWISTQNRPLHYIVAVATAEPYRRQGYMRILMQQAFSWLYQQEEPFTYLMPANPAYYQSFGFRVIYDQTPVTFPDNVEEANIYAKQHFDVVTLRDERYLEFLAAEPKESIKENKTVSGNPVESTWKPQIMSRIIHVTRLLECLRAKQAQEIYLHIQDSWIEENTGWYRWLIDTDSSVVERISVMNDQNHVKNDQYHPHKYLYISIEELTEQLFGRAPLHPILKHICILNVFVLMKKYR